MLTVYYPESDHKLDLAGIFSIVTDVSFDTLYIGDPSKDIVVGYIGQVQGKYVFKADSAHYYDYQFDPHIDYEGVFFDVLRVIANEPELAHELAILSMRKAISSNELDKVM